MATVSMHAPHLGFEGSGKISANVKPEQTSRQHLPSSEHVPFTFE
jgi:hypothetical protein